MFSVGRSEKSASRRTRGVHETLELERRHNIGALRVGKFVVFVDLYRFKAGSNYDSTVLFLDEFVLGMIINGTGGADL